jgi:hypothetical protein
MFAQVRAVRATVCKTVGLAYPGSNPWTCHQRKRLPGLHERGQGGMSPVRLCLAQASSLRLVPENTRRSSAPFAASIVTATLVAFMAPSDLTQDPGGA